MVRSTDPLSSEKRSYWRWALAWMLYWIGHGAWLLVDIKADVDEPPRWWHWCFRVYNFGMCHSAAIQGSSNFGPWETANE